MLQRVWEELTCAVSQAERILSICEVHISVYFLFKFGGIIVMFLDDIYIIILLCNVYVNIMSV